MFKLLKHTFFLLLFIIWALLILQSCLIDKNPIGNDYQLYGKILDHIKLEYPHTTILIKDTTIFLDITRIRNSVIKQFPDIDSTIFSIYVEINQSSEQIKYIPPTNHEKVYFLDNYNGSLRDEEVYGLISFSRVAFNKMNSQAIICFEDYGAPLNAAASLAYFRYNNNEWELEGYYLIWIS